MVKFCTYTDRLEYGKQFSTESDADRLKNGKQGFLLIQIG